MTNLLVFGGSGKSPSTKVKANECQPRNGARQPTVLHNHNKNATIWHITLEVLSGRWTISICTWLANSFAKNIIRYPEEAMTRAIIGETKMFFVDYPVGDDWSTFKNFAQGLLMRL